MGLLWWIARTLVGPLYLGWRGSPWWTVLVWAGVCGLWFLWRNSAALKAARKESFDPDTPEWWRRFADLSLFLGVTALLLIGHTAVYLFVMAVGR